MTQEEKLILEDLCVKLPYKPKLKIGEYVSDALISISFEPI